jgi:DtxR family Mn-dependent transcriptional regulator
MDAALGHPTHDPHGDPIPDAELVMPSDDALPLSRLRPTQGAIIRRVNDENPDLLRHLDNLGLIPGVQLEIIAHSPFDNNLTVKIGNKTSVLGLSITSKILVEEN